MTKIYKLVWLTPVNPEKESKGFYENTIAYFYRESDAIAGALARADKIKEGKLIIVKENTL
jgi:hypothetical protein